MVKAKDEAQDIRARQDDFFKRAMEYFDKFVPGEVVSTTTKVVTKEMIEADRLDIENPEWDFPRGGGGGRGEQVSMLDPRASASVGPNMRQQWKFFSPPRLGEKVTTKHITVSKWVKAGIPWVVRESATFGEDGRPICSNTGTWMLNGHRMGERWAKETAAKKEGPYIK